MSPETQSRRSKRAKREPDDARGHRARHRESEGDGPRPDERRGYDEHGPWNAERLQRRVGDDEGQVSPGAAVYERSRHAGRIRKLVEDAVALRDGEDATATSKRAAIFQCSARCGLGQRIAGARLFAGRPPLSGGRLPGPSPLARGPSEWGNSRVPAASRAHNSAVECVLHTDEVAGSSPAAPTAPRSASRNAPDGGSEAAPPKPPSRRAWRTGRRLAELDIGAPTALHVRAALTCRRTSCRRAVRAPAAPRDGPSRAGRRTVSRARRPASRRAGSPRATPQPRWPLRHGGFAG